MEPSTAGALAALFPFAVMLLVLLSRSVRQINQWEVGLKFSSESSWGAWSPGSTSWSR
jgi:hypothetical protein